MEKSKMETAKEKELYSIKILDVYVALIREKYPEIEIENLMDEAGIENYSRAGDKSSPGLCRAQFNRFHERLCMLTDNMRIDREAGRYAVKSECLGMIRSLVLPFVGVRRACAMMEKYAGGMTRSSHYTTRYTGKNKIEIVITPNEGIKEEPFQCQIRQGYFQGLADVFLHNELTVRHPECMFKGDRVCRYELTWKNSAFPHTYRTFLACRCCRNSDAHYVVDNACWRSAQIFLVICPALLSLGLGWAGQRVKSKALVRSLSGIHTAREEVLNQIEINAENSRVIVDIGQVLGIEYPDACSFDRAANIVGKNFGMTV